MIPISKPAIGEAEKQAVFEVLESGMLAQGARTAEFEGCFADLCGVKHAVAVSSGTSALHVALLANQIGPGDEVITTPFTFISTINTILFTGARPVFVDIDPDTFNLDPALIEPAVTPNTKAILPVHLYGYLCDMPAIQAAAERHGLAIIEDACQAVTAAYRGKAAGSFGTGAFSLYATKNLTSGEGGMITTNDDSIAEMSRMLRNHGMQQRYHHQLMGYNYRMTDLQAAIGLSQIRRLPEFTAKRRANAQYYQDNIRSVAIPQVKEGYEHVWHQYTLRINGGRDRDAAVQQLSKAGIGTGIYYPIPAHQQPYIQEIVGEVRLPIAEQMAREVLSIPVHPLLSDGDLETIVREVNRL